MTKEKILEAHARIAPFINRTPVFTNSTFNALTGVDAYFKCENVNDLDAGIISPIKKSKIYFPLGVFPSKVAVG